MNKVTVETINGKLCTVIWHMTWQGGLLPRGRNWTPAPYGYVYVMDLPEMEKHVCAVALFALPRHPKPKDAKLLYRYMAEGISLIANRLEPINRKPESTHRIEYVLWGWYKANPPLAEYEITHALTETGERVEIALEDSHD